MEVIKKIKKNFVFLHRIAGIFLDFSHYKSSRLRERTHFDLYFRSSTIALWWFERVKNNVFVFSLSLWHPYFDFFFMLGWPLTVVNTNSLKPSHGHCERQLKAFLLNYTIFYVLYSADSFWKVIELRDQCQIIRMWLLFVLVKLGNILKNKINLKKNSELVAAAV